MIADVYKMSSEDLYGIYGSDHQHYHVMPLAISESASYRTEDIVYVCLVLETGNQTEIYLYDLLHNAELVA